MTRLGLEGRTSGNLTILCLGSHSDDIEIGCGGTILRLAEQYPNCVFCWAVFSANGVRDGEARRAAELFAGSRLSQLFLKTFKDGFMPYIGGDVKSVFETELKQLKPDLIFTHNRHDAHQDHRLISELTRNTFRNHLILEYEIPKYDGDLGQPSVFVPLEAETCERKVSYLFQAFKSQENKAWFDRNLFLSLMRIRGMECNAPSGYAEAFYCHKLTL
jgi:LmbE family N-acetylglucosaminyl deacetylase